MTQLIPFDPNQGGRIANLCLDNVRRGYGIANKYDSAWEAWQHTEQHTDRNIPQGLAVPLYYSYTATIDNITKNYGHINVQLPDGRVWSDGNYYANVDAYMANHSPKFVGWGESVNDFKVIGGEDMVNPEDVYALFQGFRNRPPNQDELNMFVGKWTYSALIKALNSGPDRELVVRQLTTGITAENDDWVGQIQAGKIDDSGARLVLTALMILVQNGDNPDRQPTKPEIENLLGKPYKQGITEIMQTEPYKHNLAKVKYYDQDVANAGNKKFKPYMGPQLGTLS